jgi:O-succinylbenzoate synthase
MKIAGATFFRYSLPLTRPLDLRGTSITRRDGIIVAVHADNGGVGYGEIAPLPGFSAEAIEDALGAARRCVGSLRRRNDIAASLPPALREREMFPPSVRFGIECALLDLTARSRNVSPSQVYSDAPARTIRINALLSGTRAAILEAANAAASNGYTAVKLKVGRGPMEEDVKTVRELRHVLGGAIEIRLDANRAWEFDRALAFARETVDCHIAYIEEPIRDPARLGPFAAQSPIPVAVDETLQDAGWKQLYAWRQAGYLEPFAEIPDDADPFLCAILAARVWVVKPTLVGMPLTYLAHLLTKRRRIDADLVISSSFESGLGLVALANLAACAGEDALCAGLDTASWLAQDVLGPPLPVCGGAIVLAEANAIASRFTPDALEVVSDD